MVGGLAAEHADQPYRHHPAVDRVVGAEQAVAALGAREHTPVGEVVDGRLVYVHRNRRRRKPSAPPAGSGVAAAAASVAATTAARQRLRRRVTPYPLEKAALGFPRRCSSLGDRMSQ